MVSTSVRIQSGAGQVVTPVSEPSAPLLTVLIIFELTNGASGQVVIYSLNTPEVFHFDMKRPMRTVALEPNFAKRSGRAFVSGGLAGNLMMHEKGWLGHKETLLDSGEGPIWQTRWRGRLIAWANDRVSAPGFLASLDHIEHSSGSENIRHDISNADFLH